MSDKELQSFIESTCNESHLRVEADLGDGFVRLRTDEAQRRQALQDIRSTEDIVIELLRNARDAHAHSIFVATSREGDIRTLTVIDDGDGVPKHLHETIFEPRVTSKLESAHMDQWGIHGRGMALYSIKMNTLQAQVVNSTPGLGSSFAVKIDNAKLSEKADQSSFPSFEKSETGTIVLRGPKNIVRTICEFVLENKSKHEVYYGSPAEIASVLYWKKQSDVMPSQAIFSEGDEEISLQYKLAYASCPQEFANISSSIGLNLSERTARRIMDGEIKPADAILWRIASSIDTTKSASKITSKDKHKSKHKSKSASFRQVPLRISSKDIDQLKKQTSRLFSPIAQRYYLLDDVEVMVSQKNNSLMIEIPLESKE